MARPSSKQPKTETHRGIIASHAAKLRGEQANKENPTQKERLYRYLFFLSFTLNILWILSSIIFMFWLFSSKSDSFIVTRGLERYCDPKGGVARYYMSLDSTGHGQNLWERICYGPSQVDK